MVKVLFILKERNGYGAQYGVQSSGVSYGLINSCKHIADCLKPYKIKCYIKVVVDNNCIDKILTEIKPDFCFIEALWVVPEKFPILLKLHPKVKFNVRLHSNLPFLSQEAIAFEWLRKYNEIAKYHKHFSVSANNMKLVRELNEALNFNIGYTPNCYPLDNKIVIDTKPIGEHLDIGCFSALRVLKNIPAQAIAAINVANSLNKKLNFHINHTVFEQAADGVYRNLKNMFEATKHHKLIEHEWKNLEEFKVLINKMDCGMQVSMSETWNLVASDFVSCGVPIVGSHEIEFLAPQYQAAPTEFSDIVTKLQFALKYKPSGLHIINEYLLRTRVEDSIKQWLNYLENATPSK